MRARGFVVLVLIALVSTSAFAQGVPTEEPERLENGRPDYHQYEAEVLEVVDADTLRLRLHVLPGLEYTILVRQKGVDAPELRRPGCDWEKQLAIEAKDAIEKRFPVASWVYVENVELGKYSGRIIADIKQRYGNQRWRTVKRALLERDGRWGVEYDADSDFDWCEPLAAE